MAYYKCAMMEIETKFNVLNEEFSLRYDRTPISGIKTRLKRLDSIVKKLRRDGTSLSLTSMEEICCAHYRWCKSIQRAKQEKPCLVYGRRTIGIRNSFIRILLV